MNLRKGEFWDTTETAFRGCSRISTGCYHCWAQKFAWRHAHNPKIKHLYTGTIDKNGWTGKVNYNPSWWIRLSRVKKPQRVLFNCMGDFFHGSIPPVLTKDTLAQIEALHWHLFILPTKRPDIAMQFFTHWNTRLKNLILLISIEDQTTADYRLPITTLCRPHVAAVGAICEPLLGHIEIGHHLSGLDWVLAGGETGHQARFMHPFSAGKIASDCAVAHVPFFFKQWGRQLPGRLLGGAEHNGGPKIWIEWK